MIIVIHLNLLENLKIISQYICIYQNLMMIFMNVCFTLKIIIGMEKIILLEK
jgi:hypothetical protein